MVHALWIIISLLQLFHLGIVKAATGSIKTNWHICVPIKLYSKKYTMDFVFGLWFATVFPKPLYIPVYSVLFLLLFHGFIHSTIYWNLSKLCLLPKCLPSIQTCLLTVFSASLLWCLAGILKLNMFKT